MPLALIDNHDSEDLHLLAFFSHVSMIYRYVMATAFSCFLFRPAFLLLLLDISCVNSIHVYNRDWLGTVVPV